MSTKTEVIGSDLVVTRTFRARRDLVFNAWTDPEQVQSWWGCGDTTGVTSTVDLRVGGEYRHVMRIKEAGEYSMEGTFTEVDPPKRLAYTVPGQEIGGFETPETLTSIDFLERGDRTEVRLIMHGIAATPLKDIVTGGWTAAFDKLSKVVEEASQPVG